MSKKMIAHYRKLYIIETRKGSNYGLRKDPTTNRLVLKRISSTWFPAYYGCIEDSEKKGSLDDQDFYLITDRNFNENIGIPDFNVKVLGRFECYDERKNELDSKLIIGLKDEVDLFPDNRIIQELDNIRCFLINLRASFKVKSFTILEGLEKRSNIVTLLTNLDFNVQTLWPKGCPSLDSSYSYND